jgi:hypothetical protein
VRDIRFSTHKLFVDREAEMATILKFNHEANRTAFENRPDELPDNYLCTTTQFYGAGKSLLLNNYVPLLTNPASAAAIAKKYEDLFCVGEDQRVARGKSAAALAAIAGMRATITDCGCTVEETLLWLVHDLKSTWQFSLADCAMAPPRDKFQMALEQARTLGPVFIGLDELWNFSYNLSALTSENVDEAKQAYAGQTSALAKSIDASNILNLAEILTAYKSFCKLRSGLLDILQKTAIDSSTQLPRHEVHFVVAGRMPTALSLLINEPPLVNEYCLKPSYLNARALLQLLSKDSIREVVLNPGYQLQGLTPESTEALVSELQRMSAGLPRLVEIALAETGGAELAINTPEAARQAVHDAAWIIARSDNPTQTTYQKIAQAPGNKDVLRALVFCDMLDVGLDVTAKRDSNNPVEREHIALLDASVYFPVTLEPHPTKANHVIPRVAWPTVASFFDGEKRDFNQLADLKLGKSREVDVIRAMRRWLVSFQAMLKLDPQQTMPLSAMLPWLPEELADVAVRVQAVQPQLIDIGVPKAAMFAQLAVAATTTTATSTSVALAWYEDPANFHKVLLLKASHTRHLFVCAGVGTSTEGW